MSKRMCGPPRERFARGATAALLCLLTLGVRPLAPQPTATATSAGHRSVSSAPQAIATARTASAAAATPGAPLTAAFEGKVVAHDLSGFEPDFDPIDRVVIAATLRGGHAASVTLPDTMLVLSTYLENFQPDTTPVLPDLLHPDQTATSLGGFMQGKAAVVNAAGKLSYRGSMLAEVFLDNSVHYIVDLQRIGASSTAPVLRLQGTFTLYKDLSLHGQTRTTRPLSAAEISSLRVPRGRSVSWQSVVSGLTVRLPKMMGTAGTPGKQKPSTPRQVIQPQPGPASSPSPLYRSLIAAGIGLVVFGVGLLIWQRLAFRKPRRPRSL